MPKWKQLYIYLSTCKAIQFPSTTCPEVWISKLTLGIPDIAEMTEVGHKQ